MSTNKASSNLDFTEFPTQDLDSWKAKIALDLKGKDWQNFIWTIEPGLTMDPAQFETNRSFEPLFDQKNLWIAHKIQVNEDFEAANGALLELLMKGVSAPQLECGKAPTSVEWSMLFDQVALEYLKPSFVFSNYETARDAISTLLDTDLGVAREKLKLTILVLGDNDFSAGERLSTQFKSKLPAANFYQFMAVPEGAVADLAACLNALHQFQNKEGQGFQCTISIGNQFLLEVAKLRAWQMLINLFSEESNVEVNQILTKVQVNSSALSGEAEQDLIRLSAMLIAANLGGVDEILLPELDPSKSNFYQRITTNIQHILQLESHIDKVGDPLAGSYYIEALSEKIAQAAWKSYSSK